MPRGRFAAFKAHVAASANGGLKAENAALVRALQKKEVKRCSKAWDTFVHECSNQRRQQRPVLRQLPPSEALPPVV
jgi:hypothetical protein